MQAHLRSLVLSMELKMKANNDALLEQIRFLLGGTSCTPLSLAEIASAFQPNVTLKPFLKSFKEAHQGNHWHWASPMVGAIPVSPLYQKEEDIAGSGVFVRQSIALMERTQAPGSSLDSF